MSNDYSDVVDEIEEARDEFIDELDSAMTELVAGVTGQVRGVDTDFNISKCRIYPNPRFKPFDIDMMIQVVPINMGFKLRLLYRLCFKRDCYVNMIL